jgi:hypothetical protein
MLFFLLATEYDSPFNSMGYISAPALMSLFREWLRRADADVEFDKAIECSGRRAVPGSAIIRVIAMINLC